jgi:hypothetical protein
MERDILRNGVSKNIRESDRVLSGPHRRQQKTLQVPVVFFVGNVVVSDTTFVVLRKYTFQKFLYSRLQTVYSESGVGHKKRAKETFRDTKSKTDRVLSGLNVKMCYNATCNFVKIF